jgi:DNA-binding NarL/FixJ family response regulator
MDAIQALQREKTGGAGIGASPRIAVVARHAGIRERMCAAVQAAGMTLADAMDEAPAHAPVDADVILLGPATIKHDGVRKACAQFPDALVVAVVQDSARHRVRSALLDGADGVVLLDELERTLGATLEAARVGQLAIPKGTSAAMTRPVLSTREKQVLGMVVLGFTNGEIAQKLVLSESTIKSHLSSAFHKLGVRSRTEAAAVILDSESGLGAGVLAISEDQ